MQNAYFDVNDFQGNKTTRLNFNFDEAQIYGKGPEYPTIELTCYFSCPQPKSQVIVKVISYLGKVTFRSKDGKRFQIGAFNENCNFHIESHEMENLKISITFPITLTIIEFIEKYRQGDLNLLIESNCIYWLWDNTAKKGDIYINNLIPIQLEYAESKWMKALTDIGFKKIKILNIPYPETINHEKFDFLISSLEKAVDNFYQGNYHSCIAYCRDIFDGIIKIKGSPSKGNSYSEKLEIFFAKNIIQIIGDKKSKLIKAISSEMWDICSPFHHTGYKEITDIIQANRNDAEFILLTTSNILSYFMKIFS